MPLDLSQVDVTSHDRYLIYEMLGREITFKTPPKRHKRSRKQTGVVEQVCRNIFENAVELTLSGNLFQFDEPAIILGHDTDIAFVYGDINEQEMSDDELFDEVRLSADRGETLHDVLSRTSPRIIKVVTFTLGGFVKRGRTWRKAS